MAVVVYEVKGCTKIDLTTEVQQNFLNACRGTVLGAAKKAYKSQHGPNMEVPQGKVKA